MDRINVVVPRPRQGLRLRLHSQDKARKQNNYEGSMHPPLLTKLKYVNVPHSHDTRMTLEVLLHQALQVADGNNLLATTVCPNVCHQEGLVGFHSSLKTLCGGERN